MSWLYSQALVAAYSAENCLDGEPSAPSNETPTPQVFLSPDRMTAFSRLFRFGMTYAPLTESRGADVLTSYLAGFPVRTSQPPAKASALPENVAAYGANLLGSLAKFDPASCSWRTPQCSLFEDSASSLATWPRWGLMRDGVCWEQSTPARRMNENASGLSLGTPTASSKLRSEAFMRNNKPSPQEFVRWQTPVADDSVERVNGKWNSRGEPKLSAQVKFPTPQTRGFTNDGDLNLLAAAAADEDEYNRMAYRAGAKKKSDHWPTPHGFSKDGLSNGPSGNELGRAVNQAKFPTPTANEDSYRLQGNSQQSKSLGAMTRKEAIETGNGGILNPAWVELLMGWPKNWTTLGLMDGRTAHHELPLASSPELTGSKRSGTARCRKSRRSHGASSQPDSTERSA